MEDAFPSPAASTLPSSSTSAFHAVTGGRAVGSIGGGADAATGAGGGAGAGAGAGGQGLGTGLNAASAEILHKLTYTDRVEEAKRIKTLAGALQDCTPTVSYGDCTVWVGGFKGWYRGRASS